MIHSGHRENRPGKFYLYLILFFREAPQASSGVPVTAIASNSAAPIRNTFASA
jgi:hypothetical protein